MTELRHLQLVILMIVKDIDELCVKNKIEYYLHGGSALGAIRHKGFIPWDDDLDIIMDHSNYDKFIAVCREQLDKEKYYLQVGFNDWPMPFSKIKLRGTHFEEPSKYVNQTGETGIFVDVFKLENAPSSKIGQLWQYCCGKYLLTYCLKKRGFAHPTMTKRILLNLSTPLSIPFLYRFFRHQSEKYNNMETKYLLIYTVRYRFKNSVYKKDVISNPIRVPFEDTFLPVPQKYDEWLKTIFGDYMTPPPADKQVGLHQIGVYFGKY